MDKDVMSDYYWQNLNDILNRNLVDNSEYRALIQKKIAAENLLRESISEKAWKQYLALDAVCNELESLRHETTYLAGAADYEKLFCKN